MPLCNESRARFNQKSVGSKRLYSSVRSCPDSLRASILNKAFLYNPDDIIVVPK